jgi:hypothetical protein
MVMAEIEESTSTRSMTVDITCRWTKKLIPLRWSLCKAVREHCKSASYRSVYYILELSRSTWKLKVASGMKMV